jgi:hypothetical protein
MSRRLFLIGSDVDDAVLVKRHVAVIDVGSLFARVKENHPHCVAFFENPHPIAS